ncbi:hypothetical protein FHS89_001692 [Rubricella aquisinus]|uniref:DUF4169 family protein n=1 Tax=Rubricella aquisinus TaxID=2028108 RepID=A0A840WWX5_9RHOB|nr:DUF4169 family protein [Rubricella aquisinus]MBB5515680.1 hypothetical protein [Rubricella aquisinus]
MAKLINLRTARKQRARAAARDAADVSSAKHGEAKSAKTLRRDEAARVAKLHDQHKRER